MSAVTTFANGTFESAEGGPGAGNQTMGPITWDATTKPTFPDFNKVINIRPIVSAGVDRRSYFRENALPRKQPGKFYKTFATQAEANRLRDQLNLSPARALTVTMTQAGVTIGPKIMTITEPLARVVNSQLAGKDLSTASNSFTLIFTCMLEGF